jgi:hypothetical protein
MEDMLEIWGLKHERYWDDAFHHQVQYVSYPVDTGASSTLSNDVAGT